MIVGWRGVAVEVIGPPLLLTGVHRQLPSFLDNEGTVVATATLQDKGTRFCLDLPDGLGVEVTDEAEFVRAAASRIELTLAHHVPDRVTVHAGVVAHNGHALLLPGRSLSGKSTLVQALVEAGATYLSDDLAPLTSSGSVQPYPRHMTRRTQRGAVRQQPAGAARPDDTPVPVAVIAFLQHEPDGTWNAEPLSAGSAVLGLIDNCLSIRRRPAQSLDVLSRVVSGAHALRGTRGDARAAAAALLELMS